jgi:hypothetical protein
VSNYRTAKPALMPTALQDPYGQSFERAQGIVFDYYAQQARVAVQQRFPQCAAADSLGALGQERLIDQGNDIQLSSPETAVNYAARLRDAWNLWQLGGSAWGMLKAFAAQGYFPQIMCQNGLSYQVDSMLNLTITVGGPLTFPLWSEFFVYFATPPSSWSSMVSPPTPSSVPSIYELRRLRKIVLNRWKPGWTVCVGIAVITSGSPGIWGAPGAVWGTGTWGGTVLWYSATDDLTWSFPPSYTWGMSGLTWGAQV